MVRAPRLSGHHVELRPIDSTTARDLEFLYSIAIAPENGYRWRYRGSIPDLAEFVKTLSSGVLVQFIVERRATSESIGLVTGYNASQRDGWCYVAALASPSFVGSGAVADGTIALIEYLFMNWAFRKIYIESIEFNYEQFQSMSAAIAHEEARLRQHVFFDGRYWDVVTAAIYREEWISWYSTHTADRYLSATVDGTPTIDEFCSEVLAALDLPVTPNAPDLYLQGDLHLDSLQMVELGAIVESMAGRTQFEMVGEILTLRDAFEWYCIASSMPVS
jgi:RimJ/RimL family protein N-acetyltransferase